MVRPAQSSTRALGGDVSGSVELPRWLGRVALLLFALHVAELVVLGEHLSQLLWPCNASALAIALGLSFRSPILNAVGLLELLIGWPFWAFNVLVLMADFMRDRCADCQRR